VTGEPTTTGPKLDTLMKSAISRGVQRRVGSALVKFAKMPWMPGVSEYSSG
jgi:hypothetical protein